MTIKEEVMIKKFEEMGALLTGHFVLTSRPDDSPHRRHSSAYVNKDVISSFPDVVEAIAIDLVDSERWFRDIDVVVAPAIGAIVFGSMLASEIECRFAFAEPEDDKMVFKRGFSNLINLNRKVVIVEDIVTSSGTLKKMIAAVKALGGEIVGVVVMWQRGPIEISEGIKVVSLVNKEYPVYRAEDCELCHQGITPNTEVGHGREFLLEFGTISTNWPANKSN